MNSLDKINDIRPNDPLDILVIEKGLRIIDVMIYKKMDFMVIVLNNRKTLHLKISDFPVLHKASEKDLKKWTLVFEGEGLEWKSLNYDHSLQGFLKNAAALVFYDEGRKVFA